MTAANTVRLHVCCKLAPLLDVEISFSLVLIVVGQRRINLRKCQAIVIYSSAISSISLRRRAIASSAAVLSAPRLTRFNPSTTGDNETIPPPRLTTNSVPQCSQTQTAPGLCRSAACHCRTGRSLKQSQPFHTSPSGLIALVWTHSAKYDSPSSANCLSPVPRG